MNERINEFYLLFIAILYRIQRLNSRFHSLSILRTRMCIEYLRKHPELSVEEVLKMYYQVIEMAKLDQVIKCEEGNFYLNSIFMDFNNFENKSLADDYARKIVQNI